MLKLAGVVENIFKAHCTTKSGTSKANVTDSSLAEISDSSWLSTFTWENFYNSISRTRKFYSNGQCFQKRKEIWTPARWNTILRSLY